MSEIVDIGYAAKNLPEGWQLCIEIEKGAAGFCLYDPDGNKNCDFCDDDLTTHAMLKQRVDRAVGIEEEASRLVACSLCRKETPADAVCYCTSYCDCQKTPIATECTHPICDGCFQGLE